MLRFALSEGQLVPDALARQLAALDTEPHAIALDQIIAAHNGMASLVAPSCPRAIAHLEREAQRSSLLHLFGPVPVVRQLVWGVLLFLAGLVHLTTYRQVDGTIDWQRHAGTTVLLQMLFLLASAGLGATFAGLYTATKYVKRLAFDPRYAPAYRNDVVLGMASGMILALLLAGRLEGTDLQKVGASTIAFVGGYSSSLVATILRTLVDAVESRVRGPKTDGAAISNRGRRAAIAKATPPYVDDNGSAATVAIAAHDPLPPSPTSSNPLITTPEPPPPSPFTPSPRDSVAATDDSSDEVPTHDAPPRSTPTVPPNEQSSPVTARGQAITPRQQLVATDAQPMAAPERLTAAIEHRPIARRPRPGRPESTQRQTTATSDGGPARNRATTSRPLTSTVTRDPTRPRCPFDCPRALVGAGAHA